MSGADEHSPEANNQIQTTTNNQKRKAAIFERPLFELGNSTSSASGNVIGGSSSSWEVPIPDKRRQVDTTSQEQAAKRKGSSPEESCNPKRVAINPIFPSQGLQDQAERDYVNDGNDHNALSLAQNGTRINKRKRSPRDRPRTTQRRMSDYQWKGQEFVTKVLQKNSKLANKFPQLSGRPPD